MFGFTNQRSGKDVSYSVLELTHIEQHLTYLVIQNKVTLAFACQIVDELGRDRVDFYVKGVGSSLTGVVWSSELTCYVAKTQWSRRVR